MKQIKAVVFDFGKVISFPPDHSVMEEIAALAGIKWEKIEPLYWKYRRDYDRGRFAVSGFFQNIFNELDHKIDKETLLKIGELDLNSWKKINPGTVELMAEIKKAGFLLGILSNMPFDYLEFARRNFPVMNLPHAGIFSCELGFIKPEEGIYLKLLSAIGCRAEELVFFDDVPENVEKALELGMEARIWQDCSIARQDLADLGLYL